MTTPRERAEKLRRQAALWDMVQEAADQQESPHRDRIVINATGDFFATHRYEVNPDNGYATVQLRDGSILPTRMGNWYLGEEAARDFFSIERKDIQIDDPREGE